MAPTCGKLEGRITVPTGGWSVSVNDGGGADTATVPAGTYYLSSPGSGSNDLLEEFRSQLATATGDTWTAAIANSEQGTGIVTLTTSDDSTITWTSTDLRDVLGFAGNLSNATQFVGTKSARSLWMPNCPYNARVSGVWSGTIETDLRSQESAAGYVFAFGGQKKYVNTLRWDAITVARSWDIHESTENQSFEQFYLDVILGEAAWSARPCGPIRWYPDAATDASYITGNIVGMSDLSLEQFREDYGGLYRVQIPRFVKEPS